MWVSTTKLIRIAGSRSVLIYISDYGDFQIIVDPEAPPAEWSDEAGFEKMIQNRWEAGWSDSEYVVTPAEFAQIAAFGHEEPLTGWRSWWRRLRSGVKP